MKTTLIVIMLFLETALAFAQRHRGNSASQEIKDAIAERFNNWLQKSQLETNSEYEVRIKNKSDERLKTITDSVVQAIKMTRMRMSYCGKLNEYDAENETFSIDVFAGDNYNSSRVDTMIIKVPRQIASGFNKFQHEKIDWRFSDVTINVQDLIIQNDKWIPSKAIILFGLCPCYPDQSFFKRYSEIIKEKDNYFGVCRIYENPRTYATEHNYKVKIQKISNSIPLPDIFYYEWDISEQPNYNPSSTKPISFSLEDLNITLPTISTNTQTASSTKIQVPDLDMSSIQTKNKNSNAFAVVIGNRDYQYTKKVSFALNDAQTIKKYLINVLGYNEGNIFYLENASKSNFETYFGTKENPQGKLYNNIKQGISDVFIYYAGHGAPGLKDNKGYFVPIDCDPQYVEQGGYSLDLFYNNISKLNAKSITVVTDACFSGAEIFNNISPIIITVSNPIAVADNCVVLSSSTGSQVSSWYNDKQHGMFTYFFLKALQDKDKSDKNKDGKLSFKEIFEYVSDKTEGVPYYARSIHGVDQTPTIQGTGVENIFIEYK